MYFCAGTLAGLGLSWIKKYNNKMNSTYGLANMCWYTEKYIAWAMNIKTQKLKHGYFFIHCWNYNGILTVF